mmetsp:Transcript_11145/g.14741  ORF Transcript_11145/g.14741 Transcript_11145/m.14741 type:complete len:123 (-) Transcript_11145:117-485(-)
MTNGVVYSRMSHPVPSYNQMKCCSCAKKRYAVVDTAITMRNHKTTLNKEPLISACSIPYYQFFFVTSSKSLPLLEIPPHTKRSRYAYSMGNFQALIARNALARFTLSMAKDIRERHKAKWMI